MDLSEVVIQETKLQETNPFITLTRLLVGLMLWGMFCFVVVWILTPEHRETR